MATFASDNFNGTDGADLTAHTPSGGGSWVKAGDGGGRLEITSAGRVMPNSNVNESVYRHSEVPPSSDYEVSADIIRRSDDNQTRMGLALRISTTSDDHYYVRYNNNGDSWLIAKSVGGTQSAIGAAVSQTLTVDQVYRVKFRVQGTTLTLLVDDVELASRTDSSHAGPGRAGIYGFDDATETTGLHLDNWQADTLSDDATGTVTGSGINVHGGTVQASDGTGNATGIVTGAGITVHGGTIAATDDARIALATNAISQMTARPASMYEATANITYAGGVAANGDIIIAEYDHDTDAATRRIIGNDPVDDHNVPVLRVLAGHRPVVVWTSHNADANVRIKVGTVDDVSSLVGATEQTLTFSGNVSYNHLYRITSLSDATQDTFWIFTRVGTAGWDVKQISVNQSTGVITTDWTRSLISGNFLYLATAEALNGSGEQIIRLTTFWNPATPSVSTHYFEINAETGAITSPVETLTANLATNTGLPLNSGTLVEIMPDAPAGSSRVVYGVRPGPDDAQFGYVEFADATPDGGTYHVFDVPSLTDTAIGSAGFSFYTGGDSNYLAGLAFPNPSSDGSLYRASGNGTTEIVERLTPDGIGGYDATTMLAQPTSLGRLVRPSSPEGGGPFALIVSQITEYVDYTDFTGNLLAAPADWADAVATVTGAGINVHGGTVTATAGQADTGTVTGQGITVNGGTVVGTADSSNDATGIVIGSGVNVSGGTVTGAAGATGIVTGSAINVQGGTVTATAGQSATGIVTGGAIAVHGGLVSGTAGSAVDAIGTVTGSGVSVFGGTVTATAGQAASATVIGQAISVLGGTVIGSDVALIVPRLTATVRGSVVTAEFRGED